MAITAFACVQSILHEWLLDFGKLFYVTFLLCLMYTFVWIWGWSYYYVYYVACIIVDIAIMRFNTRCVYTLIRTLVVIMSTSNIEYWWHVWGVGCGRMTFGSREIKWLAVFEILYLLESWSDRVRKWLLSHLLGGDNYLLSLREVK